MANRRDYILGIIFIIISSIGFGTLGLFNDIAEKANLRIPERLFFRYFISLIVIFIIIKLQGKSLKIERTAIKKISFGSIFYFSTTGVLLCFAYDFVGIGFSTVLHFTYPIIVLLFAIIIDKEKPSKLQILGTGLAFIGLVVVIGPALKFTAIGISLALCSAVTFSFYVRMLDKSYCKQMDTLVILFYVFLASSIVWITPSVISSFNRPSSINYKLAFLSILGLSIIGTLLSILFFTKGVKLIGGRMASILSVFEPVTSVLIGKLILKENLSKDFNLGLILLLVGIIIVTLFEKANKVV